MLVNFQNMCQKIKKLQINALALLFCYFFVNTTHLLN